MKDNRSRDVKLTLPPARLEYTRFPRLFLSRSCRLPRAQYSTMMYGLSVNNNSSVNIHLGQCKERERVDVRNYVVDDRFFKKMFGFTFEKCIILFSTSFIIPLNLVSSPPFPFLLFLYLLFASLLIPRPVCSSSLPKQFDFRSVPHFMPYSHFNLSLSPIFFLLFHLSFPISSLSLFFPFPIHSTFTS